MTYSVIFDDPRRSRGAAPNSIHREDCADVARARAKHSDRVADGFLSVQDIHDVIQHDGQEPATPAPCVPKDAR